MEPVTEPVQTEEAVLPPAVTVPSSADRLNFADVQKWMLNTLIFSSPALIALLVALQNGVDVKLAVGMAVQALIASAIDLLSKYKAGAK